MGTFGMQECHSDGKTEKKKYDLVMSSPKTMTRLDALLPSVNMSSIDINYHLQPELTPSPKTYGRAKSLLEM